MNRIKVYTRTHMDRVEMTLWFNPNMVSCVVKVTPQTYCVRIDGKDWLTDNTEEVEECILRWPVKEVKQVGGRPKGSENKSKTGHVNQK